MNWIDEKYPVGRYVEAAADDNDLHLGHITAHTGKANVGEPGTHTSGILVTFDEATYGYIEIEAEFLDQSGNGPFCHSVT